jgi:hypothetical protein
MGMNPRLLRPTESGFNPRRIAGLNVWLDPADAATVSTASGAITEIRNKSGNGIHATQTSVNNRPTYQTAARNGLNVARFDGSNDFLEVVTTFSQGPFSVFVVAVHPSNKFNGLVCEAKGVDNGNFGCTYGNSGLVSISRVGLAGTASTLNAAINVINIPVWLSTSGMVSGTVACNVRLNGTQDGTERSIGSLVANIDATCIGAGRFGNADQFNGDICEVLIYSRRLSLLETQRVEQYLARKWGVTLA